MQKTSPFAARKQKGFTLVEMGIVAVIVASLVVAVIAMLPKIKRDRYMAAGRQEVPIIVSSLRSAFIGQTSTAGLTTQMAKGFGAFYGRSNGNASGTTIAGPKGTTWQEQVFSNSVDAGGVPAGQGIVYWLVGIPTDLCMPLVQLLAAQPGVAMVYGGVIPQEQAKDANGTLLWTDSAKTKPLMVSAPISGDVSKYNAAGTANPSGLKLDVVNSGKACNGASTVVAALITI